MAGSDLACDYFNRGWLDFTGRGLDEELGDGWMKGVHPDDREYLVAELRKAAESGSRSEIEYRLRCHNGQYRWMLATTVVRGGPGGHPAGMIGTCVDITEHRQSRLELQQLLTASDAAHASLAEQTQRLHRLAETDPLTGLLNRRSFLELFERERMRSLRYQRPLALILLDIDFFKRINDSHGHAAGDTALKRIAELLIAHCRPMDVVCRYGGEEFCVMTPETTEAGAANLAERIRLALADCCIQARGRTLRVTGSFGVADCVGDLNNVDQLIERADRALYVAKQTGRDRVVRFASDDSLVEWVAQHDAMRLLADATAGDLLSPTPCIRVEATVGQAVDILLENHVGSAPVVDEQGTLVGFVSERDLMVLNVSGDAWNAPVRDVMKSNMICYEEGTPGHQVFQFLCRGSIHRVVIADCGRPIGTISDSSLLRFFRQRVADAAACVAAE